jgi:hypothetical protein
MRGGVFYRNAFVPFKPSTQNSLINEKNLWGWLILIGVILRLLQFLINRDFILEEASLALNILDHTFPELLFLSERGQYSAPLFLLSVKCMTVLFGVNDFALRIIPLLASIASLFLVYSFSLKLRASRGVALFLLALFAITLFQIRYASELKPYAVDLFFALFLGNLLIPNSEKTESKRKYVILLFSGIISILSSFTAPLVLFVLGLYRLKVMMSAGDKSIKKELILYTLWFIVFSFFISTYLLQLDGMVYLKGFWAAHFPPANPFRLEFYHWIIKYPAVVANKMIVFSFNDNMPSYLLLALLALLFLMGTIQMVKDKKYQILYFVFFPIILQWIISALTLYPFAPRLLLYLSVSFLFPVAYSLHFLVLQLNKSGALVSIVLCVILIAPGYLHYPIHIVKFKNAWEYMVDHFDDDQLVYVHFMAIPTYQYYHKTNGIKVPGKIIEGEEDWSNEKEIYSDLTALRGEVWLVFSNPFVKDGQSIDKTIVKPYENDGQLLDSYQSRQSSVYLINAQ